MCSIWWIGLNTEIVSTFAKYKLFQLSNMSDRNSLVGSYVYPREMCVALNVLFRMTVK